MGETFFRRVSPKVLVLWVNEVGRDGKMNLAYTRSERVAELIHREIAQIILQQINASTPAAMNPTWF